MNWVRKLYLAEIVFVGLLLVLPAASAHAQQEARSCFERGVEAFDAKHYDEALSLLQNAVKLNPVNLEYKYYIGLIYGGLNRDKKALGIYESLIQADADGYFKAFFDIAAIHSKNGEYDKALEVLTRAEKARPKSGRVQLEKGYAYKDLREYDKALESFERAKGLDSSLNQVAVYNMAAVRLDKGERQKAEALFNRAVELGPDTAVAQDARAALSRLYTPAAGAEQSGLHHFVDATEAYDGKEYAEALASVDKAIALAPENPEFQYYQALIYQALERNEEALEVLRRIVRKDPEAYFKAFFDIGAICSKAGRYGDALEAMNAAEKVRPDSARVHLEKGYVYKNLREYDHAVDEFKRVQAIDPSLGQVAVYNMAAVYLEKGDLDASEALFRNAVELDPSAPIAADARTALETIAGAKRAVKDWYFTGYFNWGYDDNVPLDPVEGLTSPRPGEVSGKGDQFQTLLLRGGYKFLNRKDLRIGAGYGLYCMGYKQYIESNVLAHSPHLYVEYDTYPLYFRIQYDFSYFYAGGDLSARDDGFYLNFGSGSYSKLRMNSLMPTLAIVESPRLRSDVYLIYQDKTYLDGYTPNSDFYSAGVLQSLNFSRNRYMARLGYRYAYEDADDDVSTYGLHEIQAGVSGPLVWGVRGDAGVRYTRTRFDGSFFDKDRKDSAYMFSFSLMRQFCENFQLQAGYYYTQNDSNLSSGGIDPYNFNKNIVLLSITYAY